MGELYELFPKLPKNIRQIGERDQVLKLYVEDYVNTYLKQLRPAKGADLRVGLLLGNREIHEDVPYVFVGRGFGNGNGCKGWGEGSLYRGCMAKAIRKWKPVPKRTVQGGFYAGIRAAV